MAILPQQVPTPRAAVAPLEQVCFPYLLHQHPQGALAGPTTMSFTPV
jgi:hypothetical protein